MGLVGVPISRPSAVPVVAEISTGAIKIKLDDYSIGANTGDLVWQSSAGAREESCYLLRVSSGAVRISFEEVPSLARNLPGTYPIGSADTGAPDASASSWTGSRRGLRAKASSRLRRGDLFRSPLWNYLAGISDGVARSFQIRRLIT